MREVEASFGRQFAESLNALEVGDDWQGPIRSGFGWHLVLLSGRNDEVPDFDSLRGVLANDWRSDQIQQRKQRAYEIMRSAYRIDID